LAPNRKTHADGVNPARRWRIHGSRFKECASSTKDERVRQSSERSILTALMSLSRRELLCGAVAVTREAATLGLLLGATGCRRSQPWPSSDSPLDFSRGLSRPRALQLLTWNVDARPAGQVETRARVNRVPQQLLKYDLVALSGINDPRSLRTLVTNAEDRLLHVVYGPSARAGGLLITSRWPVLTSSSSWLPSPVGANHRRHAVMHARIVVPAPTGEFGKTAIDLFNVSLGDQTTTIDKDLQNAQLEDLRGFVEDLRSSDRSRHIPAIICGAFNLGPTLEGRVRGPPARIPDERRRMGPARRGITGIHRRRYQKPSC